MELQFNKETCACMACVLREVQNAEQTQELKLPDSMGDVGKILSAWGQVILRGKEWRGDSIQVSAGMMVWVMYQPEEDSQVQCLNGWIPFQMKWDLPEHSPDGDIRVRFLTRGVDARSVSPRKIMVRSGLGALAEAWIPRQADVYKPEGEPENVALLRQQYPLRLPKEAGEKTFSLEEELRLPGSLPQLETIVYYTLRPEITEQRVLANKTVFRGNGNLHMLYLSREGQLHSWDFPLPFSQYGELDRSYSPDARVNVAVCPTSLELEPDEEGVLHLKCGMVGQYLVDDREIREVITDGYSTDRETILRRQELQLPALLEERQENIYGETQLPVAAEIAADVSVLPDFPRQTRGEGAVELAFPGTVQVLYYGEDGILRSATGRWEETVKLPADGGSSISAIPQLPPEPQVDLMPDGIRARVELPVQLFTVGESGIPMVTGMELGEPRRQQADRPSLILQRADASGLWNMAKENGSTMEAIRRANDLQGDPAPGQMLLIPIS